MEPVEWWKSRGDRRAMLRVWERRHCADRRVEACPFPLGTAQDPVPAYLRVERAKEVRRDALLSAPESAHQQWGGSPHRTEHWLSVAEGNCVAERRGGEQPEANDQSIINKMMNSIRPDALASLLSEGEAQNGNRPEREER